MRRQERKTVLFIKLFALVRGRHLETPGVWVSGTRPGNIKVQKEKRTGRGGGESLVIPMHEEGRNS